MKIHCSFPVSLLCLFPFPEERKGSGGVLYLCFGLWRVVPSAFPPLSNMLIDFFDSRGEKSEIGADFVPVLLMFSVEDHNEALEAAAPLKKCGILLIFCGFRFLL